MASNCAHHGGPQPRRASKTSLEATPTTYAGRWQIAWDFKHVGHLTKATQNDDARASGARKCVSSFEDAGPILGKARSGRHARELASSAAREGLNACIRDGQTCTAIANEVKIGMGCV